MPTLHIMQGFLGAGKSTYSRKLAQDIGAIRMNADEWVDEHFSADEQKNNWDQCFSTAIDTLWQRAEQSLKTGQDVILDFGFWNRESRDHARGKAAEWGVAIKHYYIHAPDEILLERIKKRSGPISAKNYENFHTYKQYFEEPSEDEQVVFIHNYEK